eukprot:COSAG04_NODE_12865_length_631_cov_1.071429_2_plen_80_part_01
MKCQQKTALTAVTAPLATQATKYEPERSWTKPNGNGPSALPADTPRPPHQREKAQQPQEQARGRGRGSSTSSSSSTSASA